MTTLSLCFFKRIAYFLTQVANEKLLASHMDIEASNETVTPPQKEHAAPPPRTPHAHTTRERTYTCTHAGRHAHAHACRRWPNPQYCHLLAMTIVLKHWLTFDSQALALAFII